MKKSGWLNHFFCHVGWNNFGRRKCHSVVIFKLKHVVCRVSRGEGNPVVVQMIAAGGRAEHAGVKPGAGECCQTK